MRAFVFTLVLFCSSNIISQFVYAGNVDYTPEITSEECWRRRYVALVEIADIDRSNREEEKVKLTVLDVYGDRMPVKQYTIPVSSLWFGRFHENVPENDSGWSYRTAIPQAPPIYPGEKLVLFVGKENEHIPFVVKKIADNDVENNPLVQSLRRIKAVRENAANGNAPIFAGCVDSDLTFAMYCMKRLLDGNVKIASPLYLRKLIDMRDQETMDVKVRILADRLLVQFGSVSADESYAWTKGLLIHSEDFSFLDLEELRDHLVDFSSKKAETVEFFLSQINDKQKSIQYKYILLTALVRPEVFDYSNLTDKSSVDIMNAYFDLLRDEDPKIRVFSIERINDIWIRTEDKPNKDFFRKRALREFEILLLKETDKYVLDRIEKIKKEMLVK